MKISNAEINAANYALTELLEKPLDLAIMEHALIAALKVRKARKQAKRDRQRKEKDKQVMESVNIDHSPMPFWINTVLHPKAPEWDGTFGVGNWQMRNGHPVKIVQIVQTRHGEMLMSDNGSLWTSDTGSRTGGGACHEADLVHPWPKAPPYCSTASRG